MRAASPTELVPCRFRIDNLPRARMKGVNTDSISAFPGRIRYLSSNLYT